MTEAKGTYRDWWRPPRLYGVDSTSRTVSFLELFYDLVYVVIIAELSHSLTDHLNIKGILEFGLLFFLVWWGWFNGTLYHDLHGNNDIRTRFFTFLQMGVIVSLAVFAHDALGDTMREFFIVFSIFILIFAYLWWRVGVHDPLHIPASRPYALFYTLFAILFILATFLPGPYNLYLIVFTTFIIFIFPLLTRSRTEEITIANKRTQRFSPAAVERFGLFNIIVLGEVIIGVVQGVAEVEFLTIKVGVTAGFGLLIAISSWWIYFDLISHHQPKETLNSGYAWIYLHLPLSMTIASLGAVLLNLVEHSEQTLDSTISLVFAGSIILMLMTTILLIQVIQIPKVHETMYRRIRIVLMFSIVPIIGTIFLTLNVIEFLGIIVIFLLFPIIYGVKIWIQMYRADPDFRKSIKEF